MNNAKSGPVSDFLIWNRMRSWSFLLLVNISAFLGLTLIVVFLLILTVISPKLWRYIIDRLIGFWFTLPLGLMRFMFGTDLRITGDDIVQNKPALIIMNHRTRLDWLFFLNVLYDIDPWIMASLKMILKSALKSIPGIGWAMATNSYLFLDRVWEKDEQILLNMLEYYADVGGKYQLILFPEGTDKSLSNTSKTQACMLARGLPIYYHVLPPKTTGFVFIVQKMRQLNYIDYIYDVTVAYPGTIVQNEVDFLLKGVCPQRVHFDIKRISISSIPDQDSQLANWLIGRWHQKEAKLASFYAEECWSLRKFEAEKDKNWNVKPFISTPGLCLMCLFWLLVTVVFVLIICWIPNMLYFMLISCSVYMLICRIYEGVEWLAVQMTANGNGSRSKEGFEGIHGRLPSG